MVLSKLLAAQNLLQQLRDEMEKFQMFKSENSAKFDEKLNMRYGEMNTKLSTLEKNVHLDVLFFKIEDKTREIKEKFNNITSTDVKAYEELKKEIEAFLVPHINDTKLVLLKLPERTSDYNKVLNELQQYSSKIAKIIEIHKEQLPIDKDIQEKYINEIT